MHASGSRRIRAKPAEVWAELCNPGTLRVCIPSCTELTGSLADGFDFVVSRKLSVINIALRGHISISSVDPLNRLSVEIKASAGLAGSFQGKATLILTSRPHATDIGFDASSQLSGWKSVLPTRKLDAVFKRGVDQFFLNFKAELESLDAD